LAVAKLKSRPYDLVLMDVQMPVMDGYAATRAWRMWERENGLRRTPVIALTAYALKEEEKKSLEAGCDAHVAKPIKKAKLLEVIAAYGRKEGAASPPAGAEGKIVIPVDGALADLVPNYLESRRKDLGSIRRALGQENYEATRVLGRSMKGSGEGYGFAFISAVGQAIEAAAQEGDGQEIQRRIDELDNYLKRLEIKLVSGS
jgi:CheY-like chemotaxis protein